MIIRNLETEDKVLGFLSRNSQRTLLHHTLYKNLTRQVYIIWLIFSFHLFLHHGIVCIKYKCLFIHIYILVFHAGDGFPSTIGGMETSIPSSPSTFPCVNE